MNAPSLQQEIENFVDVAKGLRRARAQVRRSKTTIEGLIGAGAKSYVGPSLKTLEKMESDLTDALNEVHAKLRRARA